MEHEQLTSEPKNAQTEQQEETPPECVHLAQTVASVRERIRKAARRAGREDEPVLMAAVKTANPAQINYIHDRCGIHAIGENRVPQLLEHYPHLHRQGLHISFIGTLQTNKVKYIVDKVDLIQSLDSGRLAAEIEKQMAKKEKRMAVLVEINSGHEEQKSGVAPEEAEAFCASLAAYPHLALSGFMTMAPRCPDGEAYRLYFRQTAQLAMHIWRDVLGRDGKPLLSMGMSESLEAATEENSGMVRIGRQIFTAPQ